VWSLEVFFFCICGVAWLAFERCIDALVRIAGSTTVFQLFLIIYKYEYIVLTSPWLSVSDFLRCFLISMCRGPKFSLGSILSSFLGLYRSDEHLFTSMSYFLPRYPQNCLWQCRPEYSDQMLQHHKVYFCNGRRSVLLQYLANKNLSYMK
jgi:hypothetical protein